MKELLLGLGFDLEDIDGLLPVLNDIGVYRIERVVSLLNRYYCDACFIRDVVVNNRELFLMDFDRLEYILEAISSNGELVEDVLLTII